MKEKMMKALVMHAPEDFRIEDVPVPRIEDENEIIIRVLAAGICAGDVKTLHHNIRIWGTCPEDRYIQAPVIGGHEFYGEVVEKGSNVKNVELGDYMISEQIVPCGKCEYCRQGYYWMCRESDVYGFKKHTQGAFAKYMKFHARGLNYKIPKHLKPEEAVLIEPFACSMHAVERAKIKHTDVVVISGLGVIGLGMVNAARLCAPKLLIGLDLRENRRQKALEFGCDMVIDPSSEDAVTKIKELTDGYGCDVYIEAVGAEKSVQQGLSMVRNLGRFVEFGVFPDLIKANWNTIGDEKEIDILGSHLGPYCYPPVIKGIADGSIKTDGVCSHMYPLTEWKAAFDAAKNDPSAIKIALIPE